MITFKLYNQLIESKKQHVTFDFDYALCGNKQQPNSIGLNLLKKHLKNEDIVGILTTRKETEQNIKQILKFLKDNIPKRYDNLEQVIYFTDGKDKNEYIKKLNDRNITIDTHYDDDPEEIKLINRDGLTKGILIDIDDELKKQWKEEYGIEWDDQDRTDEWNYQYTRYDNGDFVESRIDEGLIGRLNI